MLDLLLNLREDVASCDVLLGQCHEWSLLDLTIRIVIRSQWFRSRLVGGAGLLGSSKRRQVCRMDALLLLHVRTCQFLESNEISWSVLCSKLAELID